MAPKKVEEKKKVLRFGFIIHYAIDYKIDENAHKVIYSISSVSLIKALESVTRQHYGCNCYYCKLYNIITEKLLERKHTYLIAPETLDYEEKEPRFPLCNNRRRKYGYNIDENYIWQFFILNHIQLQFFQNFFDYLEIYNLVLDIF